MYYTTACVHAQSLQSCSILCNPLDDRRPSSSLREISQATILEWVSVLVQRIFLSQGSNPCLLHLLHCRQILYCQTIRQTREKPLLSFWGPASWGVGLCGVKGPSSLAFQTKGPLLTISCPLIFAYIVLLDGHVQQRPSLSPWIPFSLSSVLEELDTSTQLECGSNYNWITALKYTGLAKKFAWVFP